MVLVQRVAILDKGRDVTDDAIRLAQFCEPEQGQGSHDVSSLRFKRIPRFGPS